MKIAFCLSGHLRTYDKTYESIKKEIIDKYNCDVFISTWKNLGNQFAYHAHYKEGLDKKDPIVDIETIKNIYNPISIKMDDAETEPITNKLKKEYDGLKTQNGAKLSQIMCMLYKIWDCNNLKIDYENKNNFKYDMVIRCRFDVYIKYLKLENINNKVQFIPGYMGVSDLIFFGPNQMVNDVCNIYDIMSPQIPFTYFENIEHMWNTHLINNNIPFNVSYKDIFDYDRYTYSGIYNSVGEKY